MSQRPPRSYDEIVRRTVPNPDSSWRPTREQERFAYEGAGELKGREARAPTPEEQALCADIHDALLAAGYDPTAIECEVDVEHVVLRGRVWNRKIGDRIVDLVGRVEGVRYVVDQLMFVERD